MTQLEPVLKHCLRYVAREVALKEAARSLELYPHRRAHADQLFQMASLLREERLRLLQDAGVLE